ncbi:MAG: hypothetical protein IJG42_10025 [Muribaculaceae bacterium]|nr:hypothetical protein [Muribaculaceae bacterium]
MRKARKVFFVLSIVIAVYAVWTQTYRFNVEKATKFLTKNRQEKSTHCCAWYTMRALQEGGCPAIILPAQWYSYFMPLVQFEEVPQDGYTPMKGDVAVFERPEWRSWKMISQWWGHVDMYNGEQWISDFKQQKMNPYNKPVPYRIYRYKKQETRNNKHSN